MKRFLPIIALLLGSLLVALFQGCRPSGATSLEIEIARPLPVPDKQVTEALCWEVRDTRTTVGSHSLDSDKLVIFIDGPLPRSEYLERMEVLRVTSTEDDLLVCGVDAAVAREHAQNWKDWWAEKVAESRERVEAQLRELQNKANKAE